MFRSTRLTAAASAFFMPTLSYLGVGALDEAAGKMLNLGFKKPLLVCDVGVEKAGILGTVVETLEKKCQMKPVIFKDVHPNPTAHNVETGLELLNRNSCDSVISLGGGSPQDCAKGVALVKTNGGSIFDYEGLNKAEKDQFPLVAINTTSGTASEMTRFAVITDEKRHVKMVIVTERITPLIAVNDALLMVGQPPALTAATGMDALTHAIEAYVSLAASPITDACALQAMKLVKQHLANAVRNGKDLVAREGMCYAEFIAGMAFNSASLGYVHAMAHQLGGFYDLPHGVCNAILLPHVQQYNSDVCAHRLRDVAGQLGAITTGMDDKEAAAAAVNAIRHLSKEVNIPLGFKELGMREEDIPALATAALQDACAVTNPRQGSKEDVMNIYREAM
ncbi:alcohol dehydrogenase [Trypanosoma rangeli]|uniref:Alcohol dehydrogenase 4 n=1 Tax=Trypanosoma rangeli TaxID=5698 RepID=A0A3R7LCK2_TRYRA|nr:alcohol dehydrogenase [Trypanosoma rangeli]RNF11676.1 alcohol dehydrogenase [Trypanosoma rangeli]|eukprot:RNF11676.1 alcohol dehydrogenase [Trypanosoma rangeli]